MRRIVTALLAMAVLLGLAIATPMTASADNGRNCAQELNLQRPNSTDAAAKTPVILVHGWNSNANALREMSNALAFPSVVTYRFDYRSANNLWVTEGDTAQRLAKTIVCFSKLYGGKKVIIVAHSMGGLLTREALTKSAYDMPAKQYVGHVVTIGTPHKGAILANGASVLGDVTCLNMGFWYSPAANVACEAAKKLWAVPALRLGSPELAALPPFPGGITVRAIAGEVKLRVCAPWGCSPGVSAGDLFVSVASATDEYSSTGAGDGKKVFACTGQNPIEPLSQAWCSHDNMLKTPEVQADVKSSIQAYLASAKLPLPPHRMETMFFKRLKLPYLNTWVGAMSEPGSVLNVADDTHCSDDNADCPHIYFIDLTSSYGTSAYGDDPVAAAAAQLCSTDEQQVTGAMKQVATRSVGGSPAQYYEQAHCSDGKDVSEYVWYVPSRHFLVTAHDAPSGKVDLPGLRAALDNIEWVK